MTATAEKSRNVYHRKLAVMARCKDIKPDKVHPHHKFEFISIQSVSNHLRAFCVEEGLDITPSIEAGELVLTLTNVDKPDEQIVSRWPVVEGDKGYAYTVKYPEVRVFLIGDGEENDEAEMANKSGHAATTQAQRGTSTGAVPSSAPARAASSSRPASNGSDKRPVRQAITRDENPVGCPECGSGNLELVVWPDGGRQISCSDWAHCKYREKIPEDKTAIEHAMDLAAALPPNLPANLGSDDIPFAHSPTTDERDRLSSAAWAARQ